MIKFYSALLALLLFSFNIGRAQDFSNKGKDFWLAYPAHIDGNTSRMALYISSDVNTTGSVFVNGFTIQFAVTANQATVVQIFPNTYPVINSQNEGVKTNAGIHIVSNAPVVVYAHILNAARSGSSLILPTNTLGREYIATSYRSSQNSNSGAANGSPSGSQFTVVAVENNTTVEITPSVPDVGNTRVVNVPFTVQLNQGDVYQFRSSFDRDVTGSKIRSLATGTSSCKPIAVFSGSSWTSMNCNNAQGGDNLFQQQMPLSAWGKSYITAPFADRQYDVFRIIVKSPSTAVTLNGVQLSPGSLVNNTYYEFTSSSPNVISADQPVTVVQYMISQTCDTRNGGSTGAGAPYPGDPEMVILNPIEQTINDVTVVSARNNLTPPNTNISKHFFTIIIKTNAIGNLRIDGNAPTGTPTPIGTTGYSYIHENVTNSTASNPSHRIKADSGFIALAYGLGSVESYGYNAGTNVRDLYQFVSLQNQFATINFPSTCNNTPFFFSMTFPYQPTQIKWEFGTALNAMGISDVTVNTPVSDSTWVVDGKQLYRYKLPNTYRITTPGTYPIKVIAQNSTPDGCNGQQEITYDVQVFERPKANFNFTTSGCVSDSVRFTDNSNTFGRTSVKWFWDFRDGQTSTLRNPSHLYNVANSYDVRFATVTDIGCVSDTVEKTVALSEPPVAKFGFSVPGCAGKTITFTDSSTTANAPIVKWTWTFGDATAPVVATTNAPQPHTYTTAGQYTVTLQVENSSGCKSIVFQRQVIITLNPVAGFNFTKACLPNGAVQFTDASTIGDGTQNAFTYFWKFGDGVTSTTKSPSHNYTSVGPFSATLVVTSGAGCIDSITKQVDSVYAQPQARFTAPAEEVCLGGSISLSDQSTAQNSTVTGWLWNFGDGNTSNQQNPSHIYTTAGTYTITLVATSAVGCNSAPEPKTVVVNALPTVDFTLPSPACVTNSVSFTDISAANAGNITKWTWNFGDGSTTSAQQTPTHTYATTGSYNVTLQVETNKGCISTVRTKPLVINPLPKPGFIMPGNCVNDPVSQFTDTSSIVDGSQSQFTYLWHFGDANANAGNPNTSTVMNASHRFTATGDYNVKLIVTSNNGCRDSVTQVFTINGAVPTQSFNFPNGIQRCSNDSVSVVDNSTVAPGKLVKLEIYWDYTNDPTNKVVVNNPTPGTTYRHKYPEFFSPATKTYRVKLVSYSGLNCLTEKDTTITLLATPDINFPPITPVCADAPQLQVIANTTNMTTGNGVFSGNGVTATGLFNPGTGAGTYPITFTYTGANGCLNREDQNLIIYAVPTVNAGPDRFVLEGGSAVLAATATGNSLTYTWTPATNLNNPTVLQPTSTPKDDVSYQLLVTSADGCTASDQVFVKLLKTPTIPNVFTPNGDGFNDRWEIQYLESYPGATIEVFNRYGSLVYRSIGYTKPWDGTFNGKEMPAGTYYYIINPKNGRKQISGFVDIVR